MINRFLILCLIILAGYASRAIAISGPSSVCVGTTITLTDTIMGGTWSSDNTTIATVDASGNVTGVAPGWATIIYSAGGNDYMATITVDSLPSAGTITGADSVCAWDPQLYISFPPGGMWRAQNGKGTVDTFGLFTGTTAGLDTIHYVVSNSCGRDSAGKTVHITPLANAGFILGEGSVCVGDTVRLSNNVRGGSWFQYRETVVRLADTSVIGVTQGSDTVFYRVENRCGVDTTYKVMYVTAYPDAGAITGPNVLCEGETVTLTDTIINGVWRSNSANVSISGTLQVTGVTAGNAVISYKVINVCAADSAIWPMTINPVPALPPITRNGNVLSVPEGYSYYQWIDKGGLIQGANSKSITVNALSSYYCLVRNTFGCTVISFPQTITRLECDPSSIRLYPNPVYNVFHAEWCDPVNILITGADGKTFRVNNTNQVDMLTLPAGIYQVTVFDRDEHKLTEQVITKLHQ